MATSPVNEFETCSQLACKQPGVYLMLWPGCGERLVCKRHAEVITKVGQTLYLIVRFRMHPQAGAVEHAEAVAAESVDMAALEGV